MCMSPTWATRAYEELTSTASSPQWREAGLPSSRASSPAGTGALTAQLVSPRNVAMGPNGSLYISDFGGQYVYRLDSSGTLTIVTGTGVKGFYGDNADATLAQVAYPAGLAVSADGSLYVADSGNARVRMITARRDHHRRGGAAGGGCRLDASGNLYVAAMAYPGESQFARPGSARLIRGRWHSPQQGISFSPTAT